MFTNKDDLKIYQKIQEVRIIYSQFKQNIIVQLQKLEEQIEKIIYELYQRDVLDQIYENTIENDNSIISDNEMQILVQTWNKLCYQKDDQYFPKFSDQLVKRIQKTLKFWEKQIQDTLQMDFGIIPSYTDVQYKFDLNAKFSSISIIGETIIEQTQSQTHYCFALVEQRLSQIEISSIKFKFPKFQGDIGIGICDLQILKSKNFRPQLNQTNNGAFVCFQDSYTINTEQDELNWKTKGFRFDSNDIIEVTYEPTIKKVSWKKIKNPKEGYQVTLEDNKRELHFCVIVKTQGAKVELINE